MFVLRLQDTEFQYLEQYLINIFYSNNYTQRVIYKKKVVVLYYNFEAIHNKDYSVVKTFKAASKGSLFYLGIL
ncbi:hypothetical protein KU06062659_1250003 [Flavobacterium psychrophilum]|nr:hypothetical protein KU06062659_1250003 [Flavobacterium psychrophilum]